MSLAALYPNADDPDLPRCPACHMSLPHECLHASGADRGGESQIVPDLMERQRIRMRLRRLANRGRDCAKTRRS